MANQQSCWLIIVPIVIPLVAVNSNSVRVASRGIQPHLEEKTFSALFRMLLSRASWKCLSCQQYAARAISRCTCTNPQSWGVNCKNNMMAEVSGRYHHRQLRASEYWRNWLVHAEKSKRFGDPGDPFRNGGHTHTHYAFTTRIYLFSSLPIHRSVKHIYVPISACTYVQNSLTSIHARCLFFGKAGMWLQYYSISPGNRHTYCTPGKFITSTNKERPSCSYFR